MTDLKRAVDAALGGTASALVPAGVCRVVLLDVADWLPWQAEAEAVLDAAERVRVLRQRRIEEQRMRIIAYALHRLLLAAALRCAPREVPLFRDALGCPRLADGSLATSLSHADGHVALALSMRAEGGVGVDIEPWSRAPSMADIAEHLCHPHESRRLAALDAAARGRALLELWVRKEALLKSAGVGLGRDMTSFVAQADVPLAAAEGGPADAVIRMIDAGPPCCAAVAAGEGQAVHAAWLRPG